METSPITYQGNGFTVDFPSEWKDTTQHVLEGPTVAGKPQSITIQIVPEVEADTLENFAKTNLKTTKESLHDANLLQCKTIDLCDPASASEVKKTAPPTEYQVEAQPHSRDKVEPNPSRAPTAFRALLRWRPEGDEAYSYQVQLFALTDKVGYILSSSYTEQSRQDVSAEIEGIMRSFRLAG